jgi:hypothetical protein
MIYKFIREHEGAIIMVLVILAFVAFMAIVVIMLNV